MRTLIEPILRVTVASSSPMMVSSGPVTKFCQIHANELAVVAGEDALHGEGRVRPNRHAASDRLRGLDHFARLSSL